LLDISTGRGDLLELLLDAVLAMAGPVITARKIGKQPIATDVTEKLSILQTAEFFADRTARADFLD
jgi:hypothetical protein